MRNGAGKTLVEGPLRLRLILVASMVVTGMAMSAILGLVVWVVTACVGGLSAWLVGAPDPRAFAFPIAGWMSAIVASVAWVTMLAQATRNLSDDAAAYRAERAERADS